MKPVRGRPPGLGLLLACAMLAAASAAASAQVATLCDRSAPSSWGASPTIDVLYYQGPCNPKLVPGKPSMVRVYLNWRQHEGRASVGEYDVTVTLNSSSGPIRCAAPPPFPVNVKRPDLYSRDETKSAGNSINFFGCDLDGVDRITALVGFTGTDAKRGQTRKVEHMSAAQTIRARVIFPTVGSWSEGVPAAAINAGADLLKKGRTFALQSLPVADVEWRGHQPLKITEPHLRPDTDDWMADDEWSLETERCGTETCRVFVERDLLIDDELSPEDWLWQEMGSRYDDHLIVAIVPRDFQGGWDGITRRKRGFGLNAAPNTLAVRGRTPAMVILTEDADASTVAHELGHYLGLPHHDGSLAGGISREVEGFLLTRSGGANKSATEGNGSGSRLLSLMADGQPDRGPLIRFIMNTQYNVLVDDLEADPLPRAALRQDMRSEGIRLAMLGDGLMGLGVPLGPGSRREDVRRPWQAQERSVLIRGMIDEEAGTGGLEPLEGLPRAPSPPEEGSARVVFLNASGAPLGSVPLESGGGAEAAPGDGGAIRFAFAAALPQGTRRVRLVSASGATLAEISGSASSPTVEIQPRRDGAIISTDTLRWNGTDEDRDALRYSIYYSPDGGSSWTPVAAALAEESFPLERMSPGPDPLLMVTVSDGFNVGSDRVSVRLRSEPVVLGSLPAPGDTVPPGSVVRAGFNTDLSDNALQRGPLQLLDADGEPVLGDLSYEESSRVLEFRPASPLHPGASYTVAVPADLQDRYGNRSSSPSSWQFTVEADVEPPRIHRGQPRAGARDIPLDAPIQVRFSEPIDPRSLDDLRLLEVSGKAVSVAVDYHAEERTAVLLPVRPLSPLATYRVTVGPGVRDLHGNGLAGVRAWTFHTGGADRSH